MLEIKPNRGTVLLYPSVILVMGLVFIFVVGTTYLSLVWLIIMAIFFIVLAIVSYSLIKKMRLILTPLELIYENGFSKQLKVNIGEIDSILNPVQNSLPTSKGGKKFYITLKDKSGKTLLNIDYGGPFPQTDLVKLLKELVQINSVIKVDSSVRELMN